MRRAICLVLVAAILGGRGPVAPDDPAVAAARLSDPPGRVGDLTATSVTATSSPGGSSTTTASEPSTTSPVTTSPVTTTTAAPATEAPSPIPPSPAPPGPGASPEVDDPVPAGLRTPDPSPARLQAAVERLPAKLARTGIVYVAGDHPEAPGRWGVYDRRANAAYAGARAFADDERLFMVVAHETGHALIDRGLPASIRDELLERTAATAGGIDPDEALADCFAIVWGATRTNYWSCPGEVRGLAEAAFDAW